MKGRHRPGTDKGFTFVELMVVILIIGLASSAVLLAIPAQGGSVYAEAERFAARAKSLRDQAIVESRPASIRVGAGGYSLAIRQSGEWKAFARFEWAPGTRVRWSGPQGDATRFESTGLASPFKVDLERGQRQVEVEIAQDGSVLVRR